MERKLNYNAVKQIADERNLDAAKLFKALNWWSRHPNFSDSDVEAASRGESWQTVHQDEEVELRWNDCNDPDRFALDEYYQQA